MRRFLSPPEDGLPTKRPRGPGALNATPSGLHAHARARAVYVPGDHPQTPRARSSAGAANKENDGVVPAAASSVRRTPLAELPYTNNSSMGQPALRTRISNFDAPVDPHNHSRFRNSSSATPLGCSIQLLLQPQPLLAGMNTMRPHAPLQVQQINEFSGGERAWSSAIQTAHSRTWPDMIPNYFVENYTPEFDLTCSLDDRELDVILNVPSIPSQAETHHVDGFLDRSNAAVSPGPYVDTTRSCFPPLMNHHGGYGCLPLPPMRAAIDNDTFGSSTSTYALHPRSTVTTMNAAAGSSVALGMDMATPAIPSEVHRPPVRQQQTETTQILDFTKNRNDEREAKESYKRVSIHSTKACAVLHLHSRDPFYHVVKYNYGPKDKWGTVVYGCVSHQKCGHRVRVTSFKSFDVADKIVFAVEEKGKHSEIMSNRKRIGIHPMVKAEIDAMLAAGGSGPSGILTRLVLKYKHEGMREFRERLPKAAKIKNRRSYLSERLGLDWKIKSLVDLNEWCTPRVCDTAEKFFGPAGFDRSTDSATFAAASFSFRSDLLVLGSFRHDFVQDGVAKESFGVVMTSRQIFRNVLYAAEGQGNDGVFAAADGTYKLHYGGWTLVVFGTYQTRYLSSKLGQLSDEDTVLDIDLHYLSLHEVEFLYSTKMNFKLELEPVISSDTITKLRAMYQCDCKQFWCTGWICSHVIAVLALMKQFSLADATAILPIVKASGGQRKIPGALYNDDPKNKTLSKENLLKRLQRDPLFPRHWTITKEFTFKDDETGSEDVEMVAGVIDRWRPNGGRYKWGVKFDDDERLYFELEELVDLIVMSRRLGLDVTNSSQP
ncbi:hypothetical protein PR001_g9285 [Phytophthora rubi]|uniref:SWIM-type domain-containing protein n=1 Tax=Phytophthora rubi TaxID=129364 RepID=A0A6A3MR44_9STRA|nr:hypothetical protein PR001_g9285 [Phytophthora rubi]